jgi:hypothetical protein
MGKTQDAPKRPKKRPKPDPQRELQQLIEAQGVKPVRDLDALGRLLPSDFDPEGFLRFLETERAERRAIANRKSR